MTIEQKEKSWARKLLTNFAVGLVLAGAAFGIAMLFGPDIVQFLKGGS